MYRPSPAKGKKTPVPVVGPTPTPSEGKQHENGAGRDLDTRKATADGRTPTPSAERDHSPPSCKDTKRQRKEPWASLSLLELEAALRVGANIGAICEIPADIRTIFRAELKEVKDENVAWINTWHRTHDIQDPFRSADDVDTTLNLSQMTEAQCEQQQSQQILQPQPQHLQQAQQPHHQQQSQQQQQQQLQQPQPQHPQQPTHQPQHMQQPQELQQMQLPQHQQQHVTWTGDEQMVIPASIPLDLPPLPPSAKQSPEPTHPTPAPARQTLAEALRELQQDTKEQANNDRYLQLSSNVRTTLAARMRLQEGQVVPRLLPILSNNADRHEELVTRALWHFRDASAAYNGERPYVRNAMLRAEQVYIVEDLGRTPLIIFRNIGHEICKRRLAERMHFIAAQQTKEITLENLDIPAAAAPERFLMQVEEEQMLQVNLAHRLRSEWLCQAIVTELPKKVQGTVFPIAAIERTTNALRMGYISIVAKTEVKQTFAIARRLALMPGIEATYLSSPTTIRFLTKNDMAPPMINQIGNFLRASDALIKKIDCEGFIKGVPMDKFLEERAKNAAEKAEKTKNIAEAKRTVVVTARNNAPIPPAAAQALCEALQLEVKYAPSCVQFTALALDEARAREIHGALINNFFVIRARVVDKPWIGRLSEAKALIDEF